MGDLRVPGTGGRAGCGHKKTRRPLRDTSGIGCVLPKAGKRRDGARGSGANVPGSPSSCQFQLTSIPGIRPESYRIFPSPGYFIIIDYDSSNYREEFN
ncbi:hypothetical protein WH47_08460 [Habropoda laboriosa]|uniref:Uncharacterized protein n=1 Tax=Habropoda laboriosa TaxID=597456 RepID=A0A0L7QMZ9_9HYME|nr:hypothetical protein WH47_08460 [Habropoda laboriosa]